MNEQERKVMMNLADTIQGEINRMCVTKDLSEFDTMYGHAKKNIDKLSKMIYDARFKRGEKDDELKPCPFCGCGIGNLYIVTIEQHGFDTVGIFCNGCKQTMILEENEWEGDNEQSRIRAIEAWNRRVGED